MVDPFPDSHLPASEPERAPKAPRRRRWWRTILKILLLGIILAVGLFSYQVISSGSSPKEFFQQLAHLIASRDRELRGEAEGRINVLLLGIGGKGHEGPLLTDTMLLASFRPSTGQAALISIPRDLLVPLPGYGERRINNAYALAEIKSSGTGGAVASGVVSEAFGVPVHYYLLLDFSGFTQLIDALGGITVQVEPTLDDEFYPVPGKENAPEGERYEHLYLEAGRQRLDGTLALKYVRSRKAKGVQGSDFARSFRQQQVLAAIRDEISAFDVLRPAKLGELLRIVQDNLDTNLQLWEVQRLSQLARDLPPAAVVRHVLDDRPNGMLVAHVTNGAYVLTPRGGDFSELRQLGLNPFQPMPSTQGVATEAAAASSPTATPPAPAGSPAEPVVRIQIHNGTKVAGLAARTERFLQARGYAVAAVGNAPVQTYLRTVVYDLQPPAGTAMVLQLGRILNALTFTAGPPASPAAGDAPYPTDPDADVLIIVGQDLLELLPE